MQTRRIVLSLLIGAFVLLSANHAFSQATLRGQIFGPDGKQLLAEVRFQVISSDGSFQQYYFTDSNGRMIVPGLRLGKTYTLVVESDGSTFGGTSVTFNLESLQYLNVFLPPLRSGKEPRPTAKTVEAPVLSRSVPQEAARSYFQALALVQKGKLAEAVRPLEQAIARYDRFSEAYNDLGVVYLKLNRLEEAEKVLRRAVELDATDYRPLANLGIVLAREQRYSEAIPFLSESLHLHPGLSEAELRLGEALLESGRLDEAETHLAAAMEAKDSHRPEAMLKLAIVKVEKNDTAGAVMLLESYLAEFPKASNRSEIEYLLKRLRPKFR